MKGLSNVQLRAGFAASALALCMLLPWYRTSYPFGGGVRSDDLTAFGAFSWVEAAVLVVAGAVLYLLYARSQQRAFHLPGGDGWAVTAAGGWTLFLLIWRLFDRPDVAQGSVGVQWGLFVTMAVAVALALAGQSMRAEHRPEPPNPAADDPDWDPPSQQPTRRPPRAARRLAGPHPRPARGQAGLGGRAASAAEPRATGPAEGPAPRGAPVLSRGPAAQSSNSA